LNDRESSDGFILKEGGALWGKEIDRCSFRLASAGRETLKKNPSSTQPRTLGKRLMAATLGPKT